MILGITKYKDLMGAIATFIVLSFASEHYRMPLPFSLRSFTKIYKELPFEGDKKVLGIGVVSLGTLLRNSPSKLSWRTFSRDVLWKLSWISV